MQSYMLSSLGEVWQVRDILWSTSCPRQNTYSATGWKRNKGTFSHKPRAQDSIVALPSQPRGQEEGQKNKFHPNW